MAREKRFFVQVAVFGMFNVDGRQEQTGIGTAGSGRMPYAVFVTVSSENIASWKENGFQPDYRNDFHLFLSISSSLCQSVHNAIQLTDVYGVFSIFLNFLSGPLCTNVVASISGKEKETALARSEGKGREKH